MTDGVTSPQELDLAISGLAGIAGMLLWPTMAAWIRFLGSWLEVDRLGFGGRRRLSGLASLRVVVFSFLFVFVLASLLRAAAELREVRVEAPIFADSLIAMAVGLTGWGLYVLVIRMLRQDLRRLRRRSRFGGID